MDNQILIERRGNKSGRKGWLMMSDSTNVLSPGRTTSESEVREAIMQKVVEHKGDGLYRPSSRQIYIDCTVFATPSLLRRRSIAFVGQSLNTYLEAAKKAGMAPFDPEKLVPAEDIDSYDPSKLLIVTTGSQVNQTLNWLAARSPPRYSPYEKKPDLLLYSAKMIPLTKKKLMRMMNSIAKIGPTITMKRDDGLHSSGHAHPSELDEVLKLIKPEHFLR